MDYLHGKRLTPHYHEMDTFERAINEFEKKAKAFHNNKRLQAKVDGTETPEQRLARLNDRKTELNHLKLEAGRAKTIAAVQVRIEQYRRTSMTQQQMEQEGHHPTTVLETFMRADGRPKPSPKHTAHHIVLGKGRTENAANARIELHLHNIRINDPDNGVWMLRLIKDKGHWSMPNASAHLEIHTHNYERWVYQRLLGAVDQREARATLRQIGDLLQSGKQPPNITMPPQQV